MEEASNNILCIFKEVIETKPVGYNKEQYEYCIDDNIRMLFEFGLRCPKAYHEELKPDLSFDNFTDDDADLSQMGKLVVEDVEESADCDVEGDDDN